MTRIFRTTTPASEIRVMTIDNGASALILSRDGWAIELIMDRSRPLMNRRRILGDPSSATRADFDQTIKPYVILLDSLGQSVLVGMGLVNAI
jgi:hypothetical protein